MNFSVTPLGGRWNPPDQRQPQRRHRLLARAGPQSEATGEVVCSEADPTLREHLRLQVAALNQAIEGTENALALVRVAGQGLDSIEQNLQRMQTLLEPALSHPKGKGAGALAPGIAPDSPWPTLQLALAAQCRAIEAVADQTRFGQKRLLDGSLGCRAAAAGTGLQFVAAGSQVRSSPPEGYAVVLTQEPTRATLLGDEPLTPETIANCARLEVREGGRVAIVSTRAGQSAEDVARELGNELLKQGLDVTVQATTGGKLIVQHRLSGRSGRIEVQSSLPGLLSDRLGRPRLVNNGMDIAGTLQGEPCLGQGQVLTGRADNRSTAGLVVRYQAPAPPSDFSAGDLPRDGWKEGRFLAGRVLVAQHRLDLRLGTADAPVLSLRIDSMRCRDLGRGAGLTGELESLEGVPRAGPALATEALEVVRQARRQAGQLRRHIEDSLGTALPAHLTALRVQAANVMAAQPHDEADGPSSMMQDLMRSIPLEGRRALVAQHHPSAPAMLRLLAEPELPTDLPA